MSEPAKVEVPKTPAPAKPEARMDAKKFEELRRICEKTPLFSQALIPQDVIDNGKLTDYSPWILCHWNPDKLTQEVMDKLYPAFCALEDPAPGEEMELFATFLTSNGYLVLHTAYSGNEGPLTVCRDTEE